MKKVIFSCCFWGLVLAARGGELALALLPGAGPHVAGQTLELQVVALNPHARDLPLGLGDTLRGTLIGQGHRLDVTLSAVGSLPGAVPAGGFAAGRYQLALPQGLSGDVILVVQGRAVDSLRTGLVLVPAGPAQGKAGKVASASSRLPASANLASAALVRNFAGRFLPNQPIYFLYGDADHAAKFQFSFDYRLATFPHGDAPQSDVATLRLGYSQRSVWDIDGASSPFYDTSYLPEIAFCSDRVMPAEISPWFTWLGWRAGLQHESNGKEGADSRSVDIVYFRPRFVLGTLGKWAFVMLPEVHAYLGESSENADIKDYRGYGKLRFYFGHNEGPSLMVTGWAGQDFDHATWQLDLAVPTRLRWLNLESYFHIQYFTGYGESLRDYRLRSDAVRAGFSLVR